MIHERQHDTYTACVHSCCLEYKYIICTLRRATPKPVFALSSLWYHTFYTYISIHSKQRRRAADVAGHRLQTTNSARAVNTSKPPEVDASVPPDSTGPSLSLDHSRVLSAWHLTASSTGAKKHCGLLVDKVGKPLAHGTALARANPTAVPFRRRRRPPGHRPLHGLLDREMFPMCSPT